MIIKCVKCKKSISTIMEYKKKKYAKLDKYGWRLDGPTCFECLVKQEIRRKCNENY